MPGRHRSSPALPLTSARLLDVLDRMYDLQVTELDWLRGIGEAIRPLVDCGGGVNVWTLNLHTSASGVGARIGLGHDVEVMWKQFLRVVPLEILTDEGLLTPISNADRCPAPRVRRYAGVGHAAMGVRSLTGLNGVDLDHHTVSICVPAPIGGRVFWPERDRTSWERISAHLGAAFRLRNRGAARKAPSLIIDPSGRLQHVAPELAASADLAQLCEAVTVVDRARRIRMPPEAVLNAWRALHEGRWSIVQSVERDGRRMLVARPNAPLHNDAPLAPGESANRPPKTPRQLSPAERRVLAALSEGHTNKLIAYELGLATSTVGTLLARAARKLGCKSRIELARVARALPRQSASQHCIEEPT